VTPYDSSQLSYDVSGGLYARAHCGAVQPVLKYPCMMYCSGCYHLRSSAWLPVFRSLSFPPSVTLPVRFCQGRFNRYCNSRNWGARLRNARVCTSASGSFHSIRTLFDYMTLRVSNDDVSVCHSATTPQHECFYVVYLVTHRLHFWW